MEYKIDAQNQILGRLATRIAVLLRGKDKPGFDPARMSVNQVIVYNSDKIRVTGKKMVQKKYRRHSGYPGGQKERRGKGKKDQGRSERKKTVKTGSKGPPPRSSERNPRNKTGS